MGYLDNSTITVDAILTKKMRKNLALGKAIDIKYFCLSDTGVDYRNYNENHPHGTNSYGEAITSMPNLEAHGNSSYTLLNKLITLDRNTTFLPTIVGVHDLYAFGNRIYPQKIAPQMHPAGSVANQQFMLVTSDDTLLEVMNCTPVGSFDEKILTHMAIENVETVQACTGTEFVIQPKEVAESHAVSAVFVELNIGIWRTFQVTMDANEILKVPDTSGAGSSLMGD